MTGDAVPEEESQRPATPSPAFQAHLARFRCFPSPTSTRLVRPGPRLLHSPAALKQEPDATSTTLSLPPKSANKRQRPREVSTPPRADGTSAHFQLKAEALDGAAHVAEEEEPPSTPQKKKKRPTRPYADPSEYAHLGDDPLPDYLGEGLTVLLCGINPGVRSAQLGLHYANPTNHFWKCLSESGMTPTKLHPSEGPSLPALGIGSVNLVARPTAEMSEISNQEMAARVPGLLRKVVRYKPKILAFVGMKICETVMRYLHRLPKPAPAGSPSPGRRKAMPKVKIGLQPVVILFIGGKEKVYIWCLPSTSARVVEYQLVDKIEIWKELKADMDRLTQSPPVELELPEGTVEYSANSLFPPAEEALASAGTSYRVTLVKEEDLGYLACGGAGVSDLPA